MEYSRKRRAFIKGSILSGIALYFPNTLEAIPTDKSSSFLKLNCDKQSPQFDFFSVDSLGKNKIGTNIILTENNYYRNSFIVKTKNNKTSYFLTKEPNLHHPAWEVKINEKSFSIVSNYYPGFNESFLINLSQYANHATLLGIMNGADGKVSLPAILHCPDMGSFRVTSNGSGQEIIYSSKRFIEHPFVKIELPSASESSQRIDIFLM